MPVYEVAPYAPLLVYQKDYTADFVRRTIEADGLLGLRIFADLPDQRLASLDFLREYSFLRRLDLSAVVEGDYDYGFLRALTQLESLSLNINRLPVGRKGNPIDLAPVAHLRRLVIDQVSVVGLELCTQLEELSLIEWKARDLEAVRPLTRVRKLMIKTSKARSLSGVDAMRGLEQLTLGATSQLADIEALRNLPMLRKIRIDGCPKLTSIETLGTLSALEELELDDCKRLASLAPLRGLKQLRRLSLLGSTDVQDGDLDPVRHIEDVSYRHRTHYNTRLETPIADQRTANNLAKIRSWQP